MDGKRQLLNKLHENLPSEFNNYFEPFIGGGALLFDLALDKATINDFNPELTNLYSVVKNDVEALIEDLKKHKNTKEYFMEIRGIDRTDEYRLLTDVERASRFIYLNKTAFNGMWRVNSKGQHNVPFGKYENPKILDEEALRDANKVLQGVTILQGDFENIKPLIKKGDFIYLDPPYVPLNETSNFTGYTSQGFDGEMQERLKVFCDYIDEIGAYFLQSNSNAPYVNELYCGYTIETVMANRAINSKGDGRGKVKEVLIKNY